MKNFYKISSIVLLLIIIILFIRILQLRVEVEFREKAVDTSLNAWKVYMDSTDAKSRAYEDTIRNLRLVNENIIER